MPSALPGHRFLLILCLLFHAPRNRSKPSLKFRNPVGLAAGYDKDTLAIKGLSALGFGHVEVGRSHRDQSGNPQPRAFAWWMMKRSSTAWDPEQGFEYVQMQLNLIENRMVRTQFRHPAADRRKVMQVRRAIRFWSQYWRTGHSNEEAVLDYLELLQNFAPYADYLAINISSPNTVGLRQLQGRDALHGLLTHLHAQRQLEEKRLEKKLPLLVKLAPDLTESELDDAIDVILQTHMDGVIATNTTLAREGLSHAPEAAVCGSPLTARSEAVLSRIVKCVDGRSRL
jgi:dihydroorotate dehydrogenase